MQQSPHDESGFDQLGVGAGEGDVLASARPNMHVALKEDAPARHISVESLTLKNKEDLPVPNANGAVEAAARLRVLVPDGVVPTNAVLICKDAVPLQNAYDASATAYYLRPPVPDDANFDKAKAGIENSHAVEWSVEKLTAEDGKDVFEFTATLGSTATTMTSEELDASILPASHTAGHVTVPAADVLDNPNSIVEPDAIGQDGTQQYRSKKVRMQATRIHGREHLPRPERKSDTAAILVIKDSNGTKVFQGHTCVKATKRNQQSDDWYHDILYPKAKELEIDTSVLSWQVVQVPQLTVTAYPGDPSLNSAHAGRSGGGTAQKPARLHISKASMKKDERQSLDDYMLGKVDTESSGYSQLVEKALVIRVEMDDKVTDAVEVDVVVIKKLDTRPGKSTTWQFEIVMKGLPDFMQILDKETTQWKVFGKVETSNRQPAMLLHALPGKHQPRKRKAPGGEPLVSPLSSSHIVGNRVVPSSSALLMGLPLGSVGNSRTHLDVSSSTGRPWAAAAAAAAAISAVAPQPTVPLASVGIDEGEQERIRRQAHLDGAAAAAALVVNQLSDADLAHHVFHQWDQNQDKVIDVGEICAGIQSVFSSDEDVPLKLRAVLDMFDNFDTDHDGKLSVDDFQALVCSPGFQACTGRNIREAAEHIFKQAAAPSAADQFWTISALASQLQRTHDANQLDTLTAQVQLLQQLALPATLPLNFPSASRPDLSHLDTNLFSSQSPQRATNTLNALNNLTSLSNLPSRQNLTSRAFPARKLLPTSPANTPVVDSPQLGIDDARNVRQKTASTASPAQPTQFSAAGLAPQTVAAVAAHIFDQAQQTRSNAVEGEGEGTEAMDVDGSDGDTGEKVEEGIQGEQLEWPELPPGPAWVDMVQGSFTALKFLGANQAARSKVRNWLVAGAQSAHKAWYRGLVIQWRISKTAKNLERARAFFNNQKSKWGMPESESMWGSGPVIYPPSTLPSLPSDDGVELFMEAATALSEAGLAEDELQTILNRLLMGQPSEEDVKVFGEWVKESWSGNDMEALVWALMSVRTMV